MDIGAQNIGRLYGSALEAVQPRRMGAGEAFDQGQESGPSFTETLADAAQETLNTLATGEQMAEAGMAGKADPHSVVEALAQTEMALEMAVTVRDRVVEAYQEILRMPV